MLTSSGINANLALLSTACGPGDALLVDAHAHASVHGGAAASAGTAIRFRHNDLDSLAGRFERLDPQAAAVVVVDGVYSMSGATAPLAEIAELCVAHGARLVVDEAHGLGVLGQEGRGAVEHTGVLHRVDAVTLAFSKSLASKAEPERRARVRENGDLLRRLLTEAGAPPLPGSGAVVAVPTGSEDATAAAWRAAYDAGVYLNAVAYPAVPRGKGVLRLSVMATHTAEQLRTAAEIVAAAVVGATLERAA